MDSEFRILKEDVNSKHRLKLAELKRLGQVAQSDRLDETSVKAYYDGLHDTVNDVLRPDLHQKELEQAEREYKSNAQSLQDEIKGTRTTYDGHIHRADMYQSQETYNWRGRWKVAIGKWALAIAEGVNVLFAFMALFNIWPIAALITLCFPVIFLVITEAIASGIARCKHWFTKGLAFVVALVLATAAFYALSLLREIMMIENGGTLVPEWIPVVISVVFFLASICVNLLCNPSPEDLKLKRDIEREQKAAEKIEGRVAELNKEKQALEKAFNEQKAIHQRYIDETASYKTFLKNAYNEAVMTFKSEYHLFHPENGRDNNAHNNHTAATAGAINRTIAAGNPRRILAFPRINRGQDNFSWKRTIVLSALDANIDDIAIEIARGVYETFDFMTFNISILKEILEEYKNSRV